MSNSNSKHPPNFVDLTGQTFGRLTVVGYAGRDKHRKTLWKCTCSCGKVRENPVAASSMRSGNTTSCGCLWDESRKTSSVTHGASKSPEHTAWKLMRQRCLNPNHPNYGDYAARRPDKAFDDFAVFLAEVGPKPGTGYTLDRVDNSKGYIAGNLRWATREEQANNLKSNRIFVCINTGARVSMAKACRDSGLKYSTVRERVSLLGWPVAEATGYRYMEPT